MGRVEHDYYAVLGVLPDATQKEITTAYRKLAMQFHPDVNPSEEAKERMPLLNEAYAVLGDAEKRKQYDAREPEMRLAPIPNKSRLVVQRVGASVGVTRKMDVILDGEVIGSLPIGGSIRFLIEPGQYTLQFKLDMTTSKVLRFTCQAGMTIGFASGAASPMEYLFRSVADPKNALFVHRIL